MLVLFCQPAFSFYDKLQEEELDDFNTLDLHLLYYNISTTISEQPVMADLGSFNKSRPGVEVSIEIEIAEWGGMTHLVHL